MPLNALLTSWSGTTCRHIRDGAFYDVLDFRFAGRSNENRWNVAGEATLYLASDHGVAIAEFARHFREDLAYAVGRTATLAPSTLARRIYDLDIAIPTLLDLRDPAVSAALALDHSPYCFLDVNIARATAHFLRQTTPACALIAPSMALLDQPDQWIMMLFLEKLPADPRAFITAVRPDGLFSLTHPSDKITPS